MKPEDVEVTSDPISFDRAFRSCFGDALAEMSKVLLARASHEASEGFVNSATQSAQQSVIFSRWASANAHPYACGLAAQLLLDLDKVGLARKICLEGLESADQDIRPDLERLLDQINGENWKSDS